MQLIFFVMTFLAALSVIGYSNFQHFIEMKRLRTAYTSFLNQETKTLYYEAEKKVYDRFLRLYEEKKQKKPTPRLSRTLNLFLMREDNQQGEMIKMVFTDILKELFNESQHPYFIQLREEIPEWPFIFANLIQSKLQDVEEMKKVSRIQRLSNLNLEHPLLQEIFKHLFEDHEDRDKWSFPHASINKFFHISKGNKVNNKVSLYLARESLLHAIFKDDTFVEEVVRERKLIHSRITKDPNSKEFESKYFRESFEERIKNSLFEYRVSSTKP